MRTLLLALLALVLTSQAAAGESSPSPAASPAAAVWPTGQALMDELSMDFGYEWTETTADWRAGEVMDLASGGTIWVQPPIDGPARITLWSYPSAPDASRHLTRIVLALGLTEDDLRPLLDRFMGWEGDGFEGTAEVTGGTFSISYLGSGTPYIQFGFAGDASSPVTGPGPSLVPSPPASPGP